MSSCRICQSHLKTFLPFGKMPKGNGFLTPSEFSSEYFFNLEAAFCPHCLMVQLVDQPDPSQMFHSAYPFFTGSSQSMKIHFKNLAQEVEDDWLSGKNPFLVEIGSNDGTFLSFFRDLPVRCLGVEPSANAARRAEDAGIPTWRRFFNDESAEDIAGEYAQADVIVGANVMCHMADMHSVLEGVAKLLKLEGIFIFEDPYVSDVIRKNAFDQIYDEHVYLFSAHSIRAALRRHNLEIFSVELLPTHGGTIRFYAAHRGKRRVSAKVEDLLRLEAKDKLDKFETYEQFRNRCEKIRHDLSDVIARLKSDGKSIVGYAATSKSTTVLNYCGLGPEAIDYISDTTPEKQGRFSPGMHLAIRPHDDFDAHYPDYAILFGWNHQDEIFAKEQKFMRAGGSWIVYVPEVHVVEGKRRVHELV